MVVALSFSSFFHSLIIMAVVKNHTKQKRAQTIWDFTSKFPDSLTVERFVYLIIWAIKVVMY